MLTNLPLVLSTNRRFVTTRQPAPHEREFCRRSAAGTPHELGFCRRSAAGTPHELGFCHRDKEGGRNRKSGPRRSPQAADPKPPPYPNTGTITNANRASRNAAASVSFHAGSPVLPTIRISALPHRGHRMAPPHSSHEPYSSRSRRFARTSSVVNAAAIAFSAVRRSCPTVSPNSRRR